MKLRRYGSAGLGLAPTEVVSGVPDSAGVPAGLQPAGNLEAPQLASNHTHSGQWPKGDPS
jgi:hypothetical protein